MAFELRDLMWEFDPAQGPLVRATGYLAEFDKTVRLKMVRLDHTRWGLVGVPIYDGVRVPVLEAPQVVQRMLDIAATALLTTNMWPGEQTPEGNGQAWMNQFEPPDDVEHVLLSVRMGAPEPTPDVWEQMWERIHARAAFDSSLRVVGYSDAEVRRALRNLEPHFPASWVRKRYPPQRVGFTGERRIEAGHDFPTYHLARTATGMLCIDPGLSCLIDIGLSIDELREVDGYATMIGQIREMSIMQQASMAADLLRKGALIAVEQPTGHGHARHDVAITVDGAAVDLELKVKTTPSIPRRISDDLESMGRKVPPNATRPIVLVVMLAGQNEVLPRAELFTIAENAAQQAPAVVSAVMLVEAFTDARGGRIQRDVLAVRSNPSAQVALDVDATAAILTSKFDEPLAPRNGASVLFTVGLADEQTATDEDAG